VSIYASFIKLEHSLFSLPLLFAGAYLAAKGWPSLRLTFLILMAGTMARIVALGLNRIIDRHIDRRNPRTKERHLASGIMTLKEAFVLISICLVLYVFSAWIISDFCLKLSWIPILAFTVYPYFKRFTHWSHLGLGLVWSLVPLAGYFAVEPSFENLTPVILLGLFCTFWLAGFDIIYATQDEEFDRDHLIHSLPASMGSKRALKWASFFHFVAFLMLSVLYAGWFSGAITVMLLFLIGLLLLWEQMVSRYVEVAFFKMNVLIGFFVLFFIYSGMKGF